MFSTIAAVCCLAALGTAVGYSPLPGICKGEVRSAAARRRGAAPPAARPSRRSLLSGAAAAALFTAVGPAVAVGPKEIALDNLTWRSTQDGVAKPMCNGRPLKVPGEKVAEGMTPKCIRVTTQATNGGKVAVKDASVFGYVRLDSGGSAIANNPDFKSDAGQFAMIPDVPAGTNQVEFEFVAVIPKEQEKYDMEFDKVKAISYPGGARYKAITECDMNPDSLECEAEEEGREVAPGIYADAKSMNGARYK